jgi:hypothetical protein
VISFGIHVVHTNGVGAQFGHANDIAFALGRVDQRVVGGELIGDAWALLAGYE